MPFLRNDILILNKITLTSKYLVTFDNSRQATLSKKSFYLISDKNIWT